jgi:hypothetical protein
MRRRLSIWLMGVGGISAPCFAWAMHRASLPVVVTDPSWPRPWPYPDGWLAGLAAWYDARNPAPDGMIKLHGELPQVCATMALGLVGCLWWLATGIRIWLSARRGTPRSAP